MLEDLDSAFFITGLLRRGDIVIFGDLTYTFSSRDGEIPPGISAAGEVELSSVTLAAGRSFDAGGSGTIDVMGGLRAWRLDGLVEVQQAGVRLAPEQRFADPIVAVRGSATLSDRWSATGYFDVGGFGVGSDLTWQAAATANYAVTENLFLSVGYRHLYIDYEDGGTAFEGSLTGPLLGATYRF